MLQDTLACLWRNLPRQTRERLCKQAGFGDYRTYAGYKWAEFQPQTREYLAPKVQLETDAASGFNRRNETMSMHSQDRTARAALAAIEATIALRKQCEQDQLDPERIIQLAHKLKTANDYLTRTTAPGQKR